MSQAYIVGEFYKVPCMQVLPSNRIPLADPFGWVPVLGPLHEDFEILEFRLAHYHIDWRFVSEAVWRRAVQDVDQGAAVGHVLSTVLSNTHGTPWRQKVEGTPELRRIKCRRAMPDFPHNSTIPDRSYRWERLERAQAFTCSKLKPGNVCPHRGIDLTPFIKEDGTVTCPGHGLRFDARTRELIQFHGSAS